MLYNRDSQREQRSKGQEINPERGHEITVGLYESP